jgi:hypothetical protein
VRSPGRVASRLTSHEGAVHVVAHGAHDPGRHAELAGHHGRAAGRARRHAGDPVDQDRPLGVGERVDGPRDDVERGQADGEQPGRHAAPP